MRRRRAVHIGLLLLAGACGIASCGKTQGSRVNVLLISLDSTRRDLLGAYGHRAPHAPEAQSSPVLDELAAQGVLFEEAYATTSWTLPSHVSLFTGQPELVHAVDVDVHKPGPERPTMAEILARHGYRTAGFFSGPYLEPHFGFDRGFERYESCYGRRLEEATRRAAVAAKTLEAARRTHPPEQLHTLVEEEQRARQWVEMLSHRDRSSAMVAEAALAELEAAVQDGRPFFLFAHFFDPHYDYVPPAPHDESFDPDYAGTLDGADFYTRPEISTLDPERPGKRVRAVSERDLEHVRALYAGELAWTDAQVGRILAKLDELGLRERTLVVVVSDHGDEFFEHGSIGHRSTLYEEQVRVPMILRLPGRLEPGTRVAGLVSMIDVLPTVLELLELPAEPGLASKSMLPLLDGREEGAGRALFGRIVRANHMSLPVPARDDPSGRAPALLLTLLETFRKGSIKITRERNWTRPLRRLSPKTDEMLRARSQALRAVEKLRWIDLERHPDEREEDHSTDFGDPRVLALLREFHDRYAALLEMRRGADLLEEEERPLDALRGLGYVDVGSGLGSAESDEFVFPPPGADLLVELERGGAGR
jgi:arylsulfatase A-like enzyme